MGSGTTQWNPEALPYGYLLHGRYRIERVLGKGGFGITYAVTDTQNGQRFATKELFPSMHVQRGADRITVCPYAQHREEFEKTKESFSKETNMLVELQNIRNVLRLYHVFSENGTSYYVMEYIDGQTLQKRLKESGPMDWATLSAVVKPVIVMLARIHEVGVIHRDVSPDNIMLLRDGNVRLIDFGNVRAYSGTMTAYVKGQFAPWEQFTTVVQQGPYTDVYSLCVTIYYCLSGKLPPKAAERYAADKAVPLWQLRPGLPESLYRAVEHGMAVRVKDRTQNMEALYREMFGTDMPYTGTGGGYATGQTGGTVKKAAAVQNIKTGHGAATLRCQSGAFAGKSWTLVPGMTVRIGRDPSCTIGYPADARGISRFQLELRVMANGSVMVCDERSSFGTYFVTPRGEICLEHGKWYKVKNNVLRFGAREQYWIG